jgi:hypothetical protein
MISDEELRKWSHFLDAQMAHFEICFAREKGGPHVADEVNTAFLEADEKFEKDAIHQAILLFIETNCWPDLSARQALLLTFRAHAARHVLLETLAGRAVGILAKAPDPKNDRKFIHWLLIDAWSTGGPAFLKNLSEAFLAQRGFRAPPRR